MKKTFFKNLIRDITGTLSRFLSIVIIIALGVAFYAGVRATSPDMKKSADYYFNKNNLMDFKLISTLGLTKDDIEEIGNINGVTSVQGTYSLDAVIEKDGHSLVLNINSLPKENDINMIKMVSGRKPDNNSEAVVEDRFLKSNNFKVGDIITLSSGNDINISDNLSNNQFKIVGTAQSPLYVSAQRQLSSVGNGSVKGFVYILPTIFKSTVYTEIYLRTANAISDTSLLNNESYKSSSDALAENLKNLGIIRSHVRYNEVFKTASDAINAASSKVESSKKEAADKFALADTQLKEGTNKLLQGRAELKKNQALYKVKIAEGEKQISAGKLQIQSAESEIASKTQDIENGKLQIAQAQAIIDSSTGNTTLLKQQLAAQENLLATGEAQLKAGVSELEKNKAAIAAAEETLSTSKTEGQNKLNAASVQIETSQKEIDTNTEKLEEEKAKAQVQFANADSEIQKNQDKLKDIKKPEWYVLGRSENVGYETYRQDSDRIDNIGKAFPLIFFLVAALVSLTTMTRMVQEKRVEIGTFKALGYSRASIVAHFLIYSLAASLIGSVVGISIGFRLFPPLIMKAYGSLYSIPDTVAPFNITLALQASLLAVLFTTAAAVIATLEELREEPASLMRPKPPKSGKPILLEKVSIIWKRLSFTDKVTSRNIFRYKARFLMTVIGIAACTGLMITGFGLKGAISGATETQFSKIYKYDFQTTLSKSISDADKNATNTKVLQDSNIKSVLFAYSKNISVNTQMGIKQDAYLVVPENKDELNKYINLNNHGNSLSLSDEGVILTEKLSTLINKKIGDTISITIDGKTINAKVSAITEQYVGHYIYISPEYYKKISSTSLEFNTFYGLLNSTSDSLEEATSKTLTGISNISSVSFKKNIHLDISNSVNSINSVVFVLIISAGVLAFVVIYNLTNININERRAELATIKLLGFYNKELALYIYRENIILTIIGSFSGILLGMLMTSFVINTAETNIMRFYRIIDPIYFLYSVVLTIIFSIVVNLALYRRFDSIDMIESLKSPE